MLPICSLLTDTVNGSGYNTLNDRISEYCIEKDVELSGSLALSGVVS
jgi:hypothetical protein